MKSGLFKIVAINIFIILLLLAAFEGATSLFLAFRGTSQNSPGELVAEVKHTDWDPLLGWINQPKVRIDNMYGKGVYLATNAQGFRNEQDFSVKKKPEEKRALCVGDSFTLGYGVNNQQTWCHVLSEIIPKLETVNMGQGGYGVDQAYLWYQRDGIKFEHDLVIFAFITSDFYRMQKKDFNGYSKPWLEIENGKLKVNAPKQSTPSSSQGSTLGNFLSQLRAFEFFQKLIWKVKLWGTSDGVLSPDAKKITAAVFEDLKRITQQNKSRLLLVHLPNADDYPANNKTDALGITIKEMAAEQGLPFISLVDRLQALPSGFDAQILFEYGNRHFNVEGNRWVAQNLQSQVQKYFSNN